MGLLMLTSVAVPPEIDSDIAGPGYTRLVL